jgi:hypothetical protein
LMLIDTDRISPGHFRNLLDTLPGPHDDVQEPWVWGAPMDIVVWLRSLGLGKYEAAFRENDRRQGA